MDCGMLSEFPQPVYCRQIRRVGYSGTDSSCIMHLYSDVVEALYRHRSDSVGAMAMLMLLLMMLMQICVAHRRSIQLYTVCEDRVMALKDVSVAESPLTLVTLTSYCRT